MSWEVVISRFSLAFSFLSCSWEGSNTGMILQVPEQLNSAAHLWCLPPILGITLVLRTTDHKLEGEWLWVLLLRQLVENSLLPEWQKASRISMLQQERFVTVRKPSLWLVCGAIDSPLPKLEKPLQHCALWEGEMERLNTLHSEPKHRLPTQRATKPLAMGLGPCGRSNHAPASKTLNLKRK